MRKMIIAPICIFLTIHFCENLQEYFFCLESVFNHKIRLAEKITFLIFKGLIFDILFTFLLFYDQKLIPSKKVFL